VKAKSKVFVLLTVAAVAIVVAFLLPPIPQDPQYHEFADGRSLFGIPNFWNVATNLLFVLVGVIGLKACIPRVPQGGLQALRDNYLVFFVGVILIGFGSGYYHAAPSTFTLLWDRLPMTLSFIALFTIVIGENVSMTYGRRLLLPLLIIAAGSVLYWYITELRGEGDLRPYGLIQFLPMVLIPLILLWFASRFSHVGYLWAILISYGFAKLAEHFDAAILGLSGLLSGHSVKHLLAGLATFWLFMALKTRRKIS